MCTDCGCQEANKEVFNHDHHHHGHHHHGHDHGEKRTLHLEKDILAKNNHIAHHNHHWFHDNNVMAINIMSSPGSGKTTLLKNTITKSNKKISVLVGDQQTDHDANVLKESGARVKQINTVSSCHLDASMIEQNLGGFVDGSEDVLIIENVGNLVCPAAFDLGENRKVALLSTTEGEEKPLKYPALFHRANLVVITKTDLIPHLDWDRDLAYKNIKAVNPQANIIEVSSKTGEGLEDWTSWIEQQ